MSTFRSMFQLCINRDNLLVPLILAANQISVHQMRKCYKLSILVQFLSVKVLASKQLFIHPCLSLLSSPCSPLLLLHSSPFLLSLPLISPPIISNSLLPSFPLSFSVPPSIHHPYCPSPYFCLPSPVFLFTPPPLFPPPDLISHHFLPSCTPLLLFISPYFCHHYPFFPSVNITFSFLFSPVLLSVPLNTISISGWVRARHRMEDWLGQERSQVWAAKQISWQEC